MEGCLLSINKIKLLDLDTPLTSGRIYPTEEVEKALNDPVVKERLDSHSLFGIMFDKYPGREINMADIAFCATKFYIENKILYTDIDILNTPNGRILNALFENNTNLDFYIVFNGELDPYNKCYNLELDYIFCHITSKR